MASGTAIVDARDTAEMPLDAAVVGPRPGELFWRVLRGASSVADWIFGALILIVGLAVLATIPVLQLLSLGYLLEVSGRVGAAGDCARGLSACATRRGWGRSLSAR